MVSPGAPAPSTVTLFAIVSALRFVIVLPARPGANWMDPPAHTLERALRSEPGPLSAAVVTVTVLGHVRRSWSIRSGDARPMGALTLTSVIRVRSGDDPSSARNAENGMVTLRQPVKSSRNEAPK